MPAKSKAQQRFFGMVDAYKKGEMPDASQSIKDAAKSMSSKEVKKFAKTKHKGLPEKVKHKKKINEAYNSYAEALQDIINNCQTPIEDMLQNPRNGDLKDTAMWLSNSFGVDYHMAYEDLINGLQGVKNDGEENGKNPIRLSERDLRGMVFECVERILKEI